MNATDAVNMGKFMERLAESAGTEPEISAMHRRVAEHLLAQVERLTSGERDDGGEAFPATETTTQDREVTTHDGPRGMSLRDYFMAHAPAEPQPWFRPTMPPHPAMPQYRNDGDENENREYNQWSRGDLDIEDMEQPRVIEFAEECNSARAAREFWQSERDKQSYIQWPCAWADAMLKARQS